MDLDEIALVIYWQLYGFHIQKTGSDNLVFKDELSFTIAKAIMDEMREKPGLIYAPLSKDK